MPGELGPGDPRSDGWARKSRRVFILKVNLPDPGSRRGVAPKPGPCSIGTLRKKGNNSTSPTCYTSCVVPIYLPLPRRRITDQRARTQPTTSDHGPSTPSLEHHIPHRHFHGPQSLLSVPYSRLTLLPRRVQSSSSTGDLVLNFLFCPLPALLSTGILVGPCRPRTFGRIPYLHRSLKTLTSDLATTRASLRSPPEPRPPPFPYPSQNFRGK